MSVSIEVDLKEVLDQINQKLDNFQKETNQKFDTFQGICQAIWSGR
jgi:hypothetical protein